MRSLSNLSRIAALALVVVGFAACSRHKAEEFPRPIVRTVDTDAIREAQLRAEQEAQAAEAARLAELERMRQDSIRAAQELELADQGMREDLTAMIFFEFDTSEPADSFMVMLQNKAQILKQNPTIKLQVEGHTDERGYSEYNLALSQRRANSVRDILVSYGVDKSRLSTLAWGEERLLVRARGDEDEFSHAQNRRAEFIITEGTFGTTPRF